MPATRLQSTSRAFSLAALLVAAAFSQPALAQEQGPLPAGASLGTVSDREGSASLRRVDAERWELACERTGLQPGDWVKTATRGANALQLRFGKGELLLGPGALIELVRQGELKVLRGEVKLAPAKGESWRVHGPDGKSSLEVAKRGVVRAQKAQLSLLVKDPKWLTSYESNESSEAMGSLLAKVDGREVALTMGYHKVTVDIRDQIARTTVEESFVNHTSSVLEGVFYFPLPADASISGFSMWIGDEQVHGEIVEKQRARAIYETILREKRDPGLLEWAGGNVFKARVYPIGHEKRIKITYTQVLPKTGDAFRYHYSLRSEMLRTHPLSKLELRVTLSSQEDLVAVTSPSHPGRFQNTKNAARFEYSEEEVTPERDFELVVRTKRAPGGDVLIPHQRSDDGYFLALVDAPPAPKSTGPAAPIDVIVIADTSASVEGPAREALLGFCESLVGSLGSKDRFNLLTSDTTVRWAFKSPQTSTADTVEQALAHVEERSPLGWTDLDAAFREAFARAQANTQIVYVGDATNTRGDADPIAFARRVGALHAATKQGNVHVVQPGSKGEGQAMASLASLGVGSVRSLGETDPATAAQELLQEISAPKLSGVSIQIKGLATAAVYPRELPNLPLGSQQIVVGRFLPRAGQAMNASIEVSASAGGKPFARSSKSSFTTSPGDGNSFIPRLWARKHLDALMEEGRSAATKKRVIELSEDFQIMTPYTSFLVLESDADRERFKVKKRFRMRDGESFFAKGRSDANYALKQKALKEAKRWRLHLRARVLERLEDMNRGLIDLLRPGAAAQLKLAAQGEVLRSSDARDSGRRGGWGNKEQAFKSELGAATPGGADKGSLSFGDEEEGGEVDETMPLSDDSNAPMASPAEPPAAKAPMPSSRSRQALEKRSESKRDYRYRGDRDGLVAGTTSSLRRLEAEKQGYFRRGLSAHQSNELAKLGFLPVEDAPAQPGAWAGFANLFPGVPQRAFDPSTIQLGWTDEIKALVSGIDRGAWLQGQNLSLEVTTSSSRVDHRGRKHLGGQGLGLLSPTGWAVSPVRPAGDDALVTWADAKERGALRLLWRVARTRPSQPLDASDYPTTVPYLFGRSLLRSFANHTATITAKTPAKVTIRFQAPPAQRRWGYDCEFDLDPQRGVILEYRYLRHGKLYTKTTYGDFVEVAGRSWPSKETPYDNKGRPTWVRTWAYRALAAPEAAKVRTAILSPRQGAVEIGPLPGIDEARQAVQDGKPRLEDRLVAVSLEVGRQRWEVATPAVEALIKALGDAEATVLFRATWRSQRRRLEELRALVSAQAGALVDGPAPVEVARANALLQWSQALAPAEQLSVLERLHPIFARQTKRVDPAFGVDSSRANLLERVGRGEDAFKLRADLTKRYPFQASVQVNYARALGQRGETDAALTHLRQRLDEGGPWLEHEASQLREEIARQLWGSVRYRQLVKQIDAWDAAGVEPALAVQHYSRLLSALVMLDREDEADERIAAWAAALPAGALSGDQATWNRLQGAIQHLLGNMPGIPYYGYPIPPERQEVLTKIAARLLDANSPQGTETFQRPWALGGQILYNHRYRQGDAAGPLLEELWAELEGSVASLSTERLRQLCEWLRGVGYAPAANREAGTKPAAGWPKLFPEIYARWEKLPRTKPAELEAAAHLEIVLLNYAERELQLACRRKLVEFATSEPEKRQRRLQLYGALVGGPWTQAEQTEVEALFQTLAPPAELKGEPLAEAQNAWIANLHDLHGWLTAARGEASFQALPGRNDLDRRQVKAQRDAFLRDARAALRARLQQTGQSWPELLRPWLEVESLWLGVKLKGDPAALLEEARATLAGAIAGANAAKSSPATDLRWRIVASRAVATQILLLGDLEATSELRKTAAQAFETLINAAMGQGNKLLEWREVLYCYLTVVNGQETLRKRLTEWFGEGKEVKERRWGQALAAAFVEVDDLARAAEILKKLADELSHEEWRRLADLYIVLDRRLESRWAKVESWNHQDEWRLQQGLQSDFYSKYQRRGKRVPEELDAEVPIRFLALLRKSQRPQNHVYLLRNYYSSTRDFRLLACLPEAAVGQSAQGIYQLAEGFRNVTGLLQEEATADQLEKHLAKVREQGKTALDQRALDMLEFLAALSAARQKQGGEAADRRALEPLERAFARASWAEGEERLWAGFLARQGALRKGAVAQEQVRQLKALVAGAKTPGDQVHLELSRHLAQVQWAYNKQREALLTLEAALNASRLEGGALPSYAWNTFEKRISFLSAMRSWRQAETEILAEVPRPSTPNQARQLQQRLNRVYLECLRGGGEVSLGREATLYQALLERTYARLGKARNENEAGQEISQVVSVIRTRARHREGRRVHNQAQRRAAAELRDDTLALAHTRLPKVLARYHHRNAPNMIGQVAQLAEEILGARDALAFQVERAENEPRWLRLCRWDAWSNRGWHMTELRRKADARGVPLYGSKLGKRFLTLVLAGLERHLRDGQSSHQSIYYVNNRTFWSAAKGDFRAKAEEVVRRHGSSEPVLQRVCQYLWHGLGELKRAIELLKARDAAGKLSRAGRELLAGYLFHAKRHAEAIPVYSKLIAERPDHLSHRLHLARCLHHTGQVKAADAAIAAAVAMLKEQKAWQEHGVIAVGRTCLQTARHELAAELIGDAIKLRTRGRSNRGVGDGTLGTYYQDLARARAGLGDTIGAVDAAAGAIVAWGGHRAQRQQALANLEKILREAKDLGKYLDHLDREVKQTGLENPLLRRTIGKVLFDRREVAAARDQLVLALEAQVTDEVTHRLLIKCYDRLRDPAAAARQLLALARVKGHDPQIYVELGDRLHKAGDGKAAERAYTTLVEQQPNEAAAQSALARVRERQRSYGEAAVHWAQCVRVRSDEPEGYIGLARTLIQAGQRAEAQKHIQTLRTREWDPRFESTVKSGIRSLERLQSGERRGKKPKRRRF